VGTIIYVAGAVVALLGLRQSGLRVIEPTIGVLP